jgi:hypothetical protein
MRYWRLPQSPVSAQRFRRPCDFVWFGVDRNGVGPDVKIGKLNMMLDDCQQIAQQQRDSASATTFACGSGAQVAEVRHAEFFAPKSARPLNEEEINRHV